jgi:minor histocompatibility antigen H13
MLVTITVMLVYRHGQPALLYLVPGVTGSLWLTGLWRGELKDMWEYTENGSLDTMDVVVEVDGEGKVFQQRVEVESKDDKKENGEGKAETETPAKNGGGGGEERKVDKEASQSSSEFLLAFSISMPRAPGPVD